MVEYYGYESRFVIPSWRKIERRIKYFENGFISTMKMLGHLHKQTKPEWDWPECVDFRWVDCSCLPFHSFFLHEYLVCHCLFWARFTVLYTYTVYNINMLFLRPSIATMNSAHNITNVINTYRHGFMTITNFSILYKISYHLSISYLPTLKTAKIISDCYWEFKWNETKTSYNIRWKTQK